MYTQLKAATAMGLMALTLLAPAPAFSQSTFPSAAAEAGNAVASMFWTEARMRAMDKNKDGMVSRQEFMDYMGAQFDTMDTKKDGMLTKAEFMDKKMMASTFPSAARE